MKKTQLIDALQNVKKQFVSYLSVVMIAMLAVMAYLGIIFASEAIKDNGTSFYRETNFRDIEVISTQLLSPEDLAAIRNVEGVRDVEDVYQTSGVLWSGSEHQRVDIVSLTERMNTPQLLEGRLPEHPGECALDQPIMTARDLSIGDTIQLKDTQGETAEYLQSSEFVITGVVLHPDHACWEVQVPGNRAVIVLPEVFDAEKLDGCCMKALIAVDGTETLNRFDKPYVSAADAVTERLKALASERETLRSDDVHGRYQDKIDEGQAQLDDAGAKLDDAREELDRNRDKLKDGEQALDDARQQIEEMTPKLAEAEQALADGKAQLESGAAELATSKEKLDDALKQLNDGEKKLGDSKKELDAADAKLKKGKSDLDDGARQLSDGQKQLDDARKELDNGRQELISGYGKIEEAKSSVRDRIDQALHKVIGSKADKFSFVSGSGDIDPDDAAVSAADFPITDNVSIDLRPSLRDYVYLLVERLQISDEELRSALGDDIPPDVTDLRGYVSDRISEELEPYTKRYGELSDGAKQWDAAHQTYLDGLEKYRSGMQELEQKSADYERALDKYNAGCAEYQSGLEKYNKARAELDDGWAKYRAGLAEYEKGSSELNEGQALYDSKAAEYQEGREALEEGQNRYEEGQEQLESGRTALESGEAAYSEGMAEFESGAAQLEQAKQDLNDLDACRWVILDMEGNASYVVIRNGANNVHAMGLTFSLVFVLVGALVIYTTVGRIVDEQRKLVGATKALGFYNREIFTKYLFYGVSGTFLGMVLGVLTGYLFVQRIMLHTYGRYYVFGAGRSAFRLGITLIVFVAGILLSSTTVWSACSNLLRSSAISLMQGKVPQINWKSKESRNDTGSLYRRLVWLNMLSDKRRVAVSIVCIAGCCALMVAGFTMKFSTEKTLQIQFTEIEHYDLRIQFDPASAAEPEQKLQKLLTDAQTQWTEIRYDVMPYSAGGKLKSAELICGDASVMSDYLTMYDPRTKEVLAAEGSGIWLHKRTAEHNGVTVGDEITLYDSAMNPYTTHITGIFNIHAGRQMMISEESYRELFGKAPENNAFLVIGGDADLNSLQEQIKDMEGIDELADIQALREMYQSFAKVLDLIALMFIGIAGMMAYFILLNIVNMYVNQKKPELTIMRVNGFTVREVIGYVSYELILSTIAGIMLGWAGGSLLGYRVMRLLESSDLQFVHTIQWGSWIWAALITMLFSAAISFLALRKIPRLKLTDAM
ncbi:MAG: hypothetical protein K5695_09645 [Oscillospiraceae bacterium]|nr:hypothetical protein [Oscillospiraceae bacterium]